jgi:two-component system sensor histidine kinase KdpD
VDDPREQERHPSQQPEPTGRAGGGEAAPEGGEAGVDEFAAAGVDEFAVEDVDVDSTGLQQPHPEDDIVDEWELDWEPGTEAVRAGTPIPLTRPVGAAALRAERAEPLSREQIEAGAAGSLEDVKSKVARRRGRLKIFLGMAPGVGKTFTMLSEAHRRKFRGEDIVVGYVEGHARPETQELVYGLEVVPRARIEYRGRIFQEMDTEAVIARHPEWVLVDELAHTNVPGAHHAKRWQSINDILDAGINVISTVNVQHLESLNDTIADLTGTRVRETFPDHFLDEADEVVVIDVTPEALINRLKRGVVYDLAKVDKALTNFFTPEKLSALRELALRRTAEEVDEELHALEAEGEILHASDVVLVPVTPRELSQRLVRRGYRIAERMQGSLYVVHVETPEHPISAKDRAQLDRLCFLARDLGAEFVELRGESIAVELVDFAKERKATWIVMGQSVRSRIQEIVRGSIVTRIMRELHGVDVVIVADPEQVTPPPVS